MKSELDSFVFTPQTGNGNNNMVDVKWIRRCGLWVAIASYGTSENLIMTSPGNGIWTSRHSPRADFLNHIADSEALGRTLAIDYGDPAHPFGTLVSSTNCIDWQLQTCPNSWWWTIERIEPWGLWIAASVGGPIRIMVAKTGIGDWVPVDAPYGFWNSLAYSEEDNILVAVSGHQSWMNFPRVMTTQDGYHWTVQETPPDVAPNYTGPLEKVVRARWMKQFVAVGGEGVVLTSPTGKVWTRQTPNLDCFIFGMVAADELETIVAVSDGGLPMMQISEDAVHWTGHDLAPETCWQAIDWSPEQWQFSMVANGGNIPVGTYAGQKRRGRRK